MESIRCDEYSWLIFERCILQNKGIIDDVCTYCITESLDQTTLTREGVEQANSSISNEALVILEEITAAQPILQQNLYDQRRYKIINRLKQADQAIGGQSRPSLKESAAAAIVHRSNDLSWLQERGLRFPDIDQTWLNQSSDNDIPDTFTCVSDFCPVDANRLTDLRAEVGKSIEGLFQSGPKFFVWPFQRRH